MNFWSSFTWCEAIGGKLASFEHMCPETQSRPSNTQNGECPNLTTVGGGTWVHSSMGWNTNKMMTINLSNGRISSSSGVAACGRDTTTCAYPFCEEK